DRRGLGHLHEREQRLLHASAAAGGEADQGDAFLQGDISRPNEAFADHGAHGAAHEVELEGGRHHRHALERAAHDNQGVILAGLFLGLSQAILVTLAVAETQDVDWLDLRPDLAPAAAVQKGLQTPPGADAQVVIALGTDLQIALQLWPVQHGIAGSAFGPQAFRHVAADPAPLPRFGADARRHQFFEPAHVLVASYAPTGSMV